MATKDLGAVTAYAYAVQNGYTGTEAQFEAKMGELPQAVLDAQAAVATVTGVQAQATQLATTAAPTATYNHTTNKIEFGIPKGNGIASITHTGTSGSVKTYTITFNDGQTTTFDVTDGELTYEYAEDNLAFRDGFYEELTAGDAEQLISTQFVEDEEVYSYRTTGGNADVSNREYLDKIVGGTIAWNQICNPTALRVAGAVVPNKGISYSKNNDGSITLSGTATETGTASFYFVEDGIIPCVSGHKYMSDGMCELYGGVASIGNGRVGAATTNGYARLWVRIAITSGNTYNVTIYPQIFDLTQMFGSAVADYIYGLEQAEAGAGVAWFKKLFPKDYYEYNAGELMSVKALSHDMVGFNAFDGEYEAGYIDPSNGENRASTSTNRTKNFIRVLPDVQYCYSNGSYSSGVRLIFYDDNYGYVMGDVSSASLPYVFTTPSNARYVKFYWDDISKACINLSWSGYRNGEYEPYEKHSYALDADLELRGIPKLSASNELYYDGDTYESDGTVTRRYGIVDLGTLTWNKGSNDIMIAQINGLKYVHDSIVINAICPKYTAVTKNAFGAGLDKTFRSDNSNPIIYIKDSAYTTVASFRSAMSGVYLVYELATPTEETADPYTEVQICDDFGTEEFVDAGVAAGTRDVSIPVQHHTKYPANLRDKLQHLPSPAEEDGDYVIYQENREMRLVPFALENYKIYGAKWDRTTNLLTRTKDAVGITTTTTNFCHKGSINEQYNNPFDAIYPWSDIYVCNVDLDGYRATGSLKDNIVAAYGDPDFTYKGSESLFVGVYVPEFWYKSIIDSSGVEYLVSPRARIGWTHSKEFIRGISFCTNAGNNKVTCGSDIPLTNIAVSQIHARANASGFDLCDIYDIDAIGVLYLIEYANMNMQAAIGDGCSSCYRENDADTITSVTTDATANTTTITIDDSAFSGVAYKGAQVDIGTSKGAVTYRGLIKDFSVSGSVYTIVLDRVLSGVTTGMYATVHGFSSCEFDILGQSIGNASGYIGTNSKANAFYRGMLMYANRYAYILGIYRQSNTNALWLCPRDKNPNNYDALNTTDHVNTGTILPIMASGAWLTVGGNAQNISGLHAFMATDTSSGSSSSPVGDQQYVPSSTTGNTILLFGGSAGYGWGCGLFYGAWGTGAGSSYWSYAGLPILRKKSV